MKNTLGRKEEIKNHLDPSPFFLPQHHPPAQGPSHVPFTHPTLVSPTNSLYPPGKAITYETDLWSHHTCCSPSPLPRATKSNPRAPSGHLVQLPGANALCPVSQPCFTSALWHLHHTNSTFYLVLRLSLQLEWQSHQGMGLNLFVPFCVPVPLPRGKQCFHHMVSTYNVPSMVFYMHH